VTSGCACGKRKNRLDRYKTQHSLKMGALSKHNKPLGLEENKP
jgi:hypothetical protein